MTLTDTGAHRRGFKGVNTHTHEGPSEISTPPRRGCPFHQGTTASCSSSSRPPRDTALTLPPQNSAHTQTAGQGRCHRRRPTKRATAAPASQRTRTHQENARRWGYQVTIPPTTSASSTTSRRQQTRWRGATYPASFTLLGTPTDASRRQQTRRRGATYPASFNSTGHPNRRVTEGGTAKE